MSRKLCIIVPTHWEALMGGSQYQAKILIEHLIKHYDVHVFYLTSRSNPDFVPNGYKIVCFSNRRGIRRFGFFFDMFRLYRALKEVKPDAIMQAVGCSYTGIAAYYAKRHDCRMLWRVTHDRSVERRKVSWWRPHEIVERWFLEYGIRNAESILAQSHYQREQLRNNYGRDASVLANFHPTPPERPRVDKGYTQVAWIANLKPVKNPSAFVRLARKFAARPDVKFVMIGSAMEDTAWTREEMAYIEATPNIEFLGRCSQDAVNEVLHATDLLVCTSDREGFSNTFIQAWMRRVPVASLKVDPDGLLSRTGLGSLSHTEDQLFADVANWIDAADERRAIGERCRAYALANHTVANIAELARLLDVPPLPKHKAANAAVVTQAA